MAKVPTDMDANLKLIQARMNDMSLLKFDAKTKKEVFYIKKIIGNIKYGYIKGKLYLTNEQLKKVQQITSMLGDAIKGYA